MSDRYRAAADGVSPIRRALLAGSIEIQHPIAVRAGLRGQLARLSREELLRARSWAIEHQDQEALGDVEQRLSDLRGGDAALIRPS